MIFEPLRQAAFFTGLDAAAGRSGQLAAQGVDAAPKPVMRRPGSMPRMRVATVGRGGRAVDLHRRQPDAEDARPMTARASPAGGGLSSGPGAAQAIGGGGGQVQLATFTALPRQTSRLSSFTAPTDSTSTSHSSAVR